MRKKYITGLAINELFVDVATFVCKRSISNFHVYTFKRFSAREISPRYCVIIMYELKKRGK